MRPTPTQIAAGIALLGAGGVAGAALPVAAQRSAPVAAAPAPVEVRTQVVRRTVRVVHHERPRHVRPRRAVAAAPRTAAPALAPAPPAVASAPASSIPARPVVTRSSSTGARRSAPRLRTRSSSTGGAGHERDDRHEHEGGGDD